MRRHGFWQALYYVCSSLQFIALVLAAGVGATPKIGLKSWPIDWHSPIQALKDSAGWAVPILIFAAGVFKVTAYMIGPPHVWKSIHRLLDSFRNEIFEIGDEKEMYKHRITLFKRVSFCCKRRPGSHWAWPWGVGRHPFSGWLVPVERSGHTKQRTNTVFLAPDNADNVEGIAGRVWAGQRTTLISDLPDLKSSGSDADIRDYAIRANVTEEWVRARLSSGKTCSRSICCISLEIKGEPWGVIVLDSTSPKAINGRKHGWAMFEKMAPVVLGELLKRA